jgi:hypothetical protein
MELSSNSDQKLLIKCHGITGEGGSTLTVQFRGDAMETSTLKGDLKKQAELGLQRRGNKGQGNNVYKNMKMRLRTENTRHLRRFCLANLECTKKEVIGWERDQ